MMRFCDNNCAGGVTYGIVPRFDRDAAINVMHFDGTAENNATGIRVDLTSYSFTSLNTWLAVATYGETPGVNSRSMEHRSDANRVAFQMALCLNYSERKVTTFAALVQEIEEKMEEESRNTWVAGGGFTLSNDECQHVFEITYISDRKARRAAMHYKATYNRLSEPVCAFDVMTKGHKQTHYDKVLLVLDGKQIVKIVGKKAVFFGARRYHGAADVYLYQGNLYGVLKDRNEVGELINTAYNLEKIPDAPCAPTYQEALKQALLERYPAVAFIASLTLSKRISDFVEKRSSSESCWLASEEALAKHIIELQKGPLVYPMCQQLMASIVKSSALTTQDKANIDHFPIVVKKIVASSLDPDATQPISRLTDVIENQIKVDSSLVLKTLDNASLQWSGMLAAQYKRAKKHQKRQAAFSSIEGLMPFFLSKTGNETKRSRVCDSLRALKELRSVVLEVHQQCGIFPLVGRRPSDILREATLIRKHRVFFGC